MESRYQVRLCMDHGICISQIQFLTRMSCQGMLKTVKVWSKSQGKGTEFRIMGTGLEMFLRQE